MPVRHLALALVVAVAACHGTPAAPGATPGAAAPAAGDAPIATGYDVMLRRGTTSGPPKRLRPRFPSL